MGKMVAPGATETVEATIADIGDNPDLVIVDEEPEEPEQTTEPVVEPVPEESVEPVVDDEPAPEVVVTAEPEKRKPGRPAK